MYKKEKIKEPILWIVWIWPSAKWIIEAPDSEIMRAWISCGLQTNQRIDIYRGPNDWKNRFDNMVDLKVFTEAKRDEYLQFLKDNEAKIVKSIGKIKDLEKIIIDKTKAVCLEFIVEPKTFKDLRNKLLNILTEIVILQSDKSTINLITKWNEQNQK